MLPPTVGPTGKPNREALASAAEKCPWKMSASTAESDGHFICCVRQRRCKVMRPVQSRYTCASYVNTSQLRKNSLALWYKFSLRDRNCPVASYLSNSRWTPMPHFYPAATWHYGSYFNSDPAEDCEKWIMGNTFCKSVLQYPYIKKGLHAYI